MAELHIVHRDLAARNILVGETLEDVRISDFGMSREVTEEYYKQESADRVPMRWMAPECISTRRYTLMSDVWSFGVLLWEFLTLGETP
jgi:serine/threonine protein kinase